jgi:integrase
MDLGWVDGKRKRKSLYGRTRRDVATKLHDARQAVGEGRPIANDRLTVGDYLDWWTIEHLPGRVGERTLPSYQQKARHMKRLLGAVPLARLTAAEVEHAFSQLAREGHTNGGVRGIRAVFRIAMKEAERKGILSRNVAALADGPRVTRREKDPLTLEEVKKIREGMRNDRLKPLFFVGLALGLREGEAFGLRWADVDLDQGTLTVNKQIQRSKGGGYTFDDPKTLVSKAQLELSPGQVAKLKAHRRSLAKERLKAGTDWIDLDLVFPNELGGPLDASNIRRHFHHVCDKVGVRRRRVHDWRVTAASFLADLNIHPDTAKQVLRHSETSTTLEYYTKSSSEKRKAAIEALDGLFNG